MFLIKAKSYWRYKILSLLFGHYRYCRGNGLGLISRNDCFLLWISPLSHKGKDKGILYYYSESFIKLIIWYPYMSESWDCCPMTEVPVAPMGLLILPVVNRRNSMTPCLKCDDLCSTYPHVLNVIMPTNKISLSSFLTRVLLHCFLWYILTINRVNGNIRWVQK